MPAPSRVVTGLGPALAVVALAIGGATLALQQWESDTGASAAPGAADPPSAEVVESARRSTVLVSATACNSIGEGVAVAIAPGLLVTNAHVVAGADAVELVAGDGRTAAATIVGIDAEVDLALLQESTLDLPVLATAAPGRDHPVVVIGRAPGPEGTDVLDVIDATITRTITIFISDIYGDGRHRRAGMELAVDIGPGDSGGPVVSATGEVVGLVFSDSQGQVDVAYGIAAVEIDTMAREQRSSEPVDPGPCRP